MGGTGAKERRRLMREAAGGAEKKVDAKSASERHSIDPNSSSSKQPTQKTPHNHDAKSHHRATSVTKSQPEKLKKKVNKPKHLKRKLETLTDDAEKEAIRKTLETFERKKEQRSRAKKQKIEKRKGLIDTSQKSKGTTSAPEPSTLSTKDPEKQTESVLHDTMDRSVQVEEKKAVEVAPENPPLIVDQQHQQRGVQGSDDSSVEEDAKPERQRGKRRRGRKDTSKIVEDSAPATTSDPSKQDKTTKEPKKEKVNVKEESATTDEKKTKKDPSRYCVGRKPVTDFMIGQSYTGKVLYVKPFGIFLDINSHSDAFCHVSRLSDDFVEDPTALFKEGDEVQARIVEIDRRKKQITVSLQSEAMIESERKSIELRKDRLDKRGKRSKSAGRKHKGSGDSETAIEPHASEHSKPRIQITSPQPIQNATSQLNQKPMHRKLAEKDSGAKTHADLKRERKLARRAERRAEKGLEGTTSASQ
eukprot:scaffold1667_cov173-Amphora_coffeaeformis.AAC.29